MLYLNCSQNGLFCPCNKQFVDEAPVQMEPSACFLWVNMEKLLCVFPTWQSTTGTSNCFWHKESLASHLCLTWSVSVGLEHYSCLWVSVSALLVSVHIQTSRTKYWLGPGLYQVSLPLSQCPSSLKRCLRLQTRDHRPKLRKLSSTWQGPH